MNIQEITQAREKVKEIQKDAESKLQELDLLQSSLSKQARVIKKTADSLDKGISDFIEKDKFIKFFEKPYALIPGKNCYYVAVPKFVKGFQAGWLWKEIMESPGERI